MKKYLLLILSEVLVILFFLVCINNFIGYRPTVINADGIGYYEYLPSTFIHHDIYRLNSSIEENTHLYDSLKQRHNYTRYGDYYVNKYPVGTAMLQLPFFTYTYLTTERNQSTRDGYQKPFQDSMMVSTLFYLFLSLFLLKKTLLLYEIKWPIIFVSQLVLAMGTGALFYTVYESSYSHIYSLFTISGFAYFSLKYFRAPNKTSFILACLFLGLTVLIRQPNILVIVFIPFLSGSLAKLKNGILWIFGNKMTMITGVTTFVLICFIQCFFWYIQTGSWILYSYQSEGFNFNSPEIFNILFSYRKGLFVYTPVLFVCTLSLLFFLKKKAYFFIVSWLIGFTIITFIFASWWSWYYGCSYGQRVYIDYYIFFFIPLSLLIQRANNLLRSITIALALCAIPINLIQTYQYEHYILHWMKMDKEKFWKVFLRTEDQFIGLNWKNTYDSHQYESMWEIQLDSVSINSNESLDFITGSMSKISELEKVSLVSVHLDHNFQDFHNAKVGLYLKDTINNKSHYIEKNLLEFNEHGLNKKQRGVFYFEIPPLKRTFNYNLHLKSNDYDITIKNIEVKFLRKKPLAISDE